MVLKCVSLYVTWTILVLYVYGDKHDSTKNCLERMKMVYISNNDHEIYIFGLAWKHTCPTGGTIMITMEIVLKEGK